MLELEKIPEAVQKDVRVGRCRLEHVPLKPASEIREAWALLPATGSGIVTLSDDVVRFDPTRREGLLLDAEVASGEETVVLRMENDTWHAWLWKESPGDSHCYIEREYLSTEKFPSGKPPRLVYRQYWTQQADPGALAPGTSDIHIWKPVGARFVGFASVSSEEEK